MTEPTALTAEEIADLRALHVQHVHRDGCHRHLEDGRLTDSTGLALYCEDRLSDWPCVTARLLAALDPSPEADRRALLTAGDALAEAVRDAIERRDVHRAYARRRIDGNVQIHRAGRR